MVFLVILVGEGTIEYVKDIVVDIRQWCGGYGGEIYNFGIRWNNVRPTYGNSSKSNPLKTNLC